LGFGFLVLGDGPKPQIPNPQSPIPNPHKNWYGKIIKFKNNLIIIHFIKMKNGIKKLKR
jgi:hypothetical protein